MTEELVQGTESNKKTGIGKILVLAAFVVGAIVLVRFTPVRNYLTATALGDFLEDAGFWAPLVFMVFYAVGVCLFLPWNSSGHTRDLRRR